MSKFPHTKNEQILWHEVTVSYGVMFLTEPKKENIMIGDKLMDQDGNIGTLSFANGIGFVGVWDNCTTPLKSK